MATVNFNFFNPDIVKGATAAYSEMGDTVNETKTSSGTSQQTTATATAGREFVRIVSSGGDVWLAFGTNPTAVNGSGRLLVAGVPEVFHLKAGYKVAVIN